MTAQERAAERAELRRQYREAKARELEDEGDLPGAAELRAGRCPCLCGEPLGGGAVRKFYVDVRHRQKRHRRRLEAAATAAGVPPRLSLHALESTNRSQERRGDAQKRPRRRTGPRPGVTVYLPDLERAERLVYWLELVNGNRAAAGGELDVELEVLETALERARRRRDRPAAA